jgi:excisionase family DNA binding protein
MKTTYSIAEVADYFRVSTRTIRVWLHKDASFPRPFKKYGTLRFRCSEVEQYWDKNTVEADDALSSSFMDYQGAS